MAVQAGGNGQVCFALKLEHFHPDRALKREEMERDAVSLVMALDGHDDAQFVLQVLAWPVVLTGGAGELEVHLITTVTGRDGEPPKPDRVNAGFAIPLSQGLTQN